MAGYLALIGGFVNAVGVVLLGSATSHVTGNVAHIATGLATHDAKAVSVAVGLVLAFVCGAIAASLVVEASLFGGVAQAYGTVLLAEAALLVAVVIAAANVAGWQSVALSAAMGMQNSMVTRLSGAVVRTTHLTGVMTDIGIEIARWLRWWGRGRGDAAQERPATAKIALLGTVALAFVSGAIAGAVSATALHRGSLVAPILGLSAAAGYAFWTGRSSSPT